MSYGKTLTILLLYANYTQIKLFMFLLKIKNLGLEEKLEELELKKTPVFTGVWRRISSRRFGRTDEFKS